jgi:hypothetical protein
VPPFILTLSVANHRCGAHRRPNLSGRHDASSWIHLAGRFIRMTAPCLLRIRDLHVHCLLFFMGNFIEFAYIAVLALVYMRKWCSIGWMRPRLLL